ncbi:hypothetical protein DCAR_0207461 [Daucus carota subsp. sativus]|uniref:Macro domain-containing protein n=1 Tax=Daucus carota subsp. sativus TaxID=79200 RepID=A0AAF0WEU0_DAUCS|nr:hypothetical protein DCAR_0207461 [Daucus carota subsp. sativus]
MDVDPQTTTKEQAEEKKGIMVILVGAPGSGKSTFCQDVMKISSRPWVRVCQDTIGNGKAGTKVQCLANAATALKEGKDVFIDRCNLEREQRADFLKLGCSLGNVHAVVLDLPAKLCISRCAKRTGHEGNLQGGKAAMVVNRMLQKKELPKLTEGFSRITYCQNENEVQAAVNTYGSLSLLDSLPSGVFGQKNSESKVQLGIMKFLKKVDGPCSAANISQVSVGNKLHNENNIALHGPESGVASSGNAGAEVKDFEHAPSGNVVNEVTDCEHTLSGNSGNEVKDCDNVGEKVKDSEDIVMVPREDTCFSDDVPTLAFPSISTADFKFSIEKASDIIVDQVQLFLQKYHNVRLVLVDLSHSSKILSLVSSKASQKKIDTSKFFTFVGDITRLYSQGGLHCNVIANAANWRLKPGGGGVNAAIYSAAGEALETATKVRAGSLMPGKALVVPLPKTSPLFSTEGITHVIHVLGPNMNPMRPNCLGNDYTKGCRVLREAYSSLFEGFGSILADQNKLIHESNQEQVLETKDQSELNLMKQFSLTDQKGKRECVNEIEMSKKCKGPRKESESDNTELLNRDDDRSTKKRDESMSKAWGAWAQALYNIAMHPDKHKNDVIEILDDVVVLHDLYPKAEKHLLVVARAAGLDQLADVRPEHLHLLRSMHNVGLKWAEKFLTENESLVFRLGYHSAPSMRQLHLHVISQDFDSKHLKNKKHWHSFTSPFFLDSVDVMEELSKQGKVTLNNDERYLTKELRCHKCRSAHPNIPRLKTHISNCQSPFPAALLQNGRLVLPPNKLSASKSS